MKAMEKALTLIGLPPMTNRDLIMQELESMDPERFAALLGLVNMDNVNADARANGIADIGEWLDSPVTLTAILTGKEDL